ncbi:MAG: alpha/beta-hydrolase family protein [Actinomycetota bacterium]|nr:alpha/beta-hydrolase family protein [Actinomycetota bacterium]
MTDKERPAPGFLSVIAAPPSIPGLGLGVVMLWFSLGSSLLPRSAMMQGVISALSSMAGYGIAVLVWFVVRWILERFHVVADRDAIPGVVRWVLLGTGAVVLAVMALVWPGWQSDQGALVGVDALGLVDGILAVVWSLAFVLLLLFIARSIRWLIWRTDIAFESRMSVGLARSVTVVLVFAIVAGLYFFIASSGLTAFANARFEGGDETTLEGIEQPTDPESSGSSASVVGWDDLGFQGRTFAGDATSVEDISAYYGSANGVRTPIRVYAGLKSADSPVDRAQLVVDELNRTNARDRAVVALVSTTGTGWVDPTAAAALEYMWRGDTAIAGMQYSFLPSWISFILDTATATESGVAINSAVIAWWEALPEDDRPRLVAFGESLGSLGSEAAYVQESLGASLDFIRSNTSGALWVGPTDANAVRSQLLDERDPSPVWLPVYDNGDVLRLVNTPGVLDPSDPTWSPPRVVYYHHPSDPVGYWNWETLWKPQEWTDHPVGPDVPDSVRWVPFTTFTQVVVDLINGFSASVGHGHNYNDVFVEGWSVVAPVDGWSTEDTLRLQEHLDSIEILGL